VSELWPGTRPSRQREERKMGSWNDMALPGLPDRTKPIYDGPAWQTGGTIEL